MLERGFIPPDCLAAMEFDSPALRSSPVILPFGKFVKVTKIREGKQEAIRCIARQADAGSATTRKIDRDSG